MAKTFTAPFAQTPKTATAVATTAVAGIDGDTPTNTVLLLTAGAEGSIITGLSAMPRATATASDLVVFISDDSGTTKRLIDSALMSAYTMATTTATPKTEFDYTDEAPFRLAAGDAVYVGSQVSLAAGIVFKATYMDY